MFGLSMGEILVIAIVAVIFLGPDKLPKAFVDIAKFIKAVKKTINDTKDMIDREVHISEIKQEALEYKKQFESDVSAIKDDIQKSSNIDEIANILNDTLDVSTIRQDTMNPRIDSMEELEQESKKMASHLKPKTASKSKTSKKSESKKVSKKAAKTQESSAQKVSSAKPRKITRATKSTKPKTPESSASEKA